MSQRVRCCPRCHHGGLDAFLLAFRFPADFRFRLTREEYDALRFQIGTSKQAEGRGGRRYMPYAYTEQGVAMLSAVLRSDTAVQVSIQTLRVRIPPSQPLKLSALSFQQLRALSCGQAEGFEPARVRSRGNAKRFPAQHARSEATQRAAAAEKADAESLRPISTKCCAAPVPRPTGPHALLQTERPSPRGNDFDNAVLRFDLGRLAQRDDFRIFDPSF